MKATNKVIEKYIVHNPSIKAQPKELNILRIHLLPEYTKVDFGYIAKNHFIRGGWVQIYENTFIRDCNNGTKYSFIKADNIGVAPHKHYFTSNFVYLYYSLYFEPIPVDTAKIDIIENEETNKRFFNFYEIELDLNKLEKIL